MSGKPPRPVNQGFTAARRCSDDRGDDVDAGAVVRGGEHSHSGSKESVRVAIRIRPMYTKRELERAGMLSSVGIYGSHGHAVVARPTTRTVLLRGRLPKQVDSTLAAAVAAVTAGEEHSAALVPAGAGLGGVDADIAKEGRQAVEKAVKFNFDEVFWSADGQDSDGNSASTQYHVFKSMGLPLVDNAFDGRNGCLFAYGQTGTGKTHSMIGSGAAGCNWATRLGIDGQQDDGTIDKSVFNESAELRCLTLATIPKSKMGDEAQAVPQLLPFRRYHSQLGGEECRSPMRTMQQQTSPVASPSPRTETIAACTQSDANPTGEDDDDVGHGMTRMAHTTGMTMLADDGTAGCAPRIIAAVFRKKRILEQNAQDDPTAAVTSWTVRIGFVEVYNEKITDLLAGAYAKKVPIDSAQVSPAPPRKGPAGRRQSTNYMVTAAKARVEEEDGNPILEIRENPKRGVHLHGQCVPIVNSCAEALALLAFGLRRRHVAETKMSERSSRSHAVFMVYLSEVRTVRVSRHEGTTVITSDLRAPKQTPSDAADDGLDDSNSDTDVTVDDPSDETASNVTLRQVGLKSRLNLIDLAGSERVGLSGVEGRQFEQATHINRSLLCLGRVIDALAAASQARAEAAANKADVNPFASRKQSPAAIRDAGKTRMVGTGGVKTSALDGPLKDLPAVSSTGIVPPFRDSKLTHLLKESLGGNSRTYMLATVSPCDLNHDETLSTLRYASRARAIVTCAKINEAPMARRMRELEQQLTSMRRLIAEAGIGVGASSDGRSLLDIAAMEKNIEILESTTQKQTRKILELQEDAEHLRIGARDALAEAEAARLAMLKALEEAERARRERDEARRREQRSAGERFAEQEAEIEQAKKNLADATEAARLAGNTPPSDLAALDEELRRLRELVAPRAEELLEVAHAYRRRGEAIARREIAALKDTIERQKDELETLGGAVAMEARDSDVSLAKLREDLDAAKRAGDAAKAEAAKAKVQAETAKRELGALKGTMGTESADLKKALAEAKAAAEALAAELAEAKAALAASEEAHRVAGEREAAKIAALESELAKERTDNAALRSELDALKAELEAAKAALDDLEGTAAEHVAAREGAMRAAQFDLSDAKALIAMLQLTDEERVARAAVVDEGNKNFARIAKWADAEIAIFDDEASQALVISRDEAAERARLLARFIRNLFGHAVDADRRAGRLNSAAQEDAEAKERALQAAKRAADDAAAEAATLGEGLKETEQRLADLERQAADAAAAAAKELDALRAALADKQAEVDALQSRADRLEHDLAAASAAAGSDQQLAAQQLVAKQAELDAALAELEAARKELSDAQAEIARLREVEAAAEAQRGELAALRAQLAEALATVESQKEKLDANAAEMAELAGRLAGVTAERDAALAEAEALRAKLAAATEALEVAGAQGDEQSKDLTELRAKLAAAEKALERLRGEKADLEDALKAAQDAAAAAEAARAALEQELAARDDQLRGREADVDAGAARTQAVELDLRDAKALIALLRLTDEERVARSELVGECNKEFSRIATWADAEIAIFDDEASQALAIARDEAADRARIMAKAYRDLSQLMGCTAALVQALTDGASTDAAANAEELAKAKAESDALAAQVADLLAKLAEQEAMTKALEEALAAERSEGAAAREAADAAAAEHEAQISDLEDQVAQLQAQMAEGVAALVTQLHRAELAGLEKEETIGRLQVELEAAHRQFALEHAMRDVTQAQDRCEAEDALHRRIEAAQREAVAAAQGAQDLANVAALAEEELLARRYVEFEEMNELTAIILWAMRHRAEIGDAAMQMANIENEARCREIMDRADAKAAKALAAAGADTEEARNAVATAALVAEEALARRGIENTHLEFLLAAMQLLFGTAQDELMAQMLADEERRDAEVDQQREAAFDREDRLQSELISLRSALFELRASSKAGWTENGALRNALTNPDQATVAVVQDLEGAESRGGVAFLGGVSTHGGVRNAGMSSAGASAVGRRPSRRSSAVFIRDAPPQSPCGAGGIPVMDTSESSTELAAQMEAQRRGVRSVDPSSPMAGDQWAFVDGRGGPKPRPLEEIRGGASGARSPSERRRRTGSPVRRPSTSMFVVSTALSKPAQGSQQRQ